MAEAPGEMTAGENIEESFEKEIKRVNALNQNLQPNSLSPVRELASKSVDVNVCGCGC